MNWTISQIKMSDTEVVASFSVTDGASAVSSDTRIGADSIDGMTEQQCVALVKEALGDQVAVYEAMVSAETNKAEPEAVPLPWAN